MSDSDARALTQRLARHELSSREDGYHPAIAGGRSGDWVSMNLGLVCTKIGSGATPRGGKDVYLPTGPYALIRSQNVLNDGFLHEGLAYIGEQHASELNGVEVRDRDVLLNITGDSVARACQVDSRILPARVNQHVAIIRPDPTKLDPGFLRYFLIYRETQAKLLSWAGAGGTRNALTKAMIEAFDVQAPEDVSEQRAVARILGTLDDKIEVNRRMNETLEAIARALFKSWFVDFDPVCAKLEDRDTGLPQDIADLFPDRLVESEMGKIPEGWEIFRLDRLADHHTKSMSPLRSPEEEYEHFSIPAYDAGQRPSIELGAAIRSNKTVVREDAVLLSKLNPRIPRVWMPANSKGRRQVCSTEFLVFTPRPPASRSLLFALFVDQSFRALLKSMVTGTSKSHQRVPPKALKTQEVLAGSPRVFRVFGEIAGSLLARVLRNRSEVTTLAALRDTLLPKLISGEMRAREASKVEAVA
ncbi:MAG: restriction endonuclease subunit S [Bryobacterales bacterium]|nr:restriction endonuclease subunit S [Bryobacterales bacterium]